MMNKWIKNEDGVVSVFWCITFTTFLLIILIFIDVGKHYSTSIKLKRLTILSMNSQLSNYNREMYEKYKIFIVRDLDDFIIEENIMNDIEENLPSNLKKTIYIDEVKIEKGMSLENIENLQEQINLCTNEHAYVFAFDELIKILKWAVNKDNEFENETCEVLTKEEYDQINIEEYSDTRNEDKQIIRDNLNGENSLYEKSISDDLLENLPSKNIANYEKNILIDFDDIEKTKNLSKNIIKEVFNVSTNNLNTNDYIMNKFNSHNNKKDNDTYLNNEIEYIIAHKIEEEKNFKYVKNKIFAFMILPNLYSIYNDSSKMTLYEITAQVLVGWWGTEGAVKLLKSLLIISEAMVDSSNDVKSLIKGEKINIIDNYDFKMGYEDFLYLFLSLMGNDEKLIYINDILYLNMNMINEQFIIQNARTGLNVTVKYHDNFLFIDDFFNTSPYKKMEKFNVCLKY